MVLVQLFVASLLFVGSHLGIAGTRLRDLLTQRLGQGGYMAVYGIVSIVFIAWMTRSYVKAPYEPLWGNPDWAKGLAVVLMLPAFLLVVLGLLTPNPTTVAQENTVGAAPRGIVTITRHPFLIGVALWAVLHLLANGDLASLVFFGALAVLGLAGTVSIDAKRRRALGEAWDGFARQTSIIPFGAVLGGRVRADFAGIGVWRPALGVLAYALMLGGHRHLIGVSPFPW